MKYTYKDLRFYEELLTRAGENVAFRDAVQDRLIEIKRQLRKRSKERKEATVVRDYCDGSMVVKLALPEDLSTAEEADAYFMEYEYIRYRPTCYDCTGQLFTAWYKIFQKPDGRFWAYHSVGIDN